MHVGKPPAYGLVPDEPALGDHEALAPMGSALRLEATINSLWLSMIIMSYSRTGDVTPLILAPCSKTASQLAFLPMRVFESCSCYSNASVSIFVA